MYKTKATKRKLFEVDTVDDDEDEPQRKKHEGNAQKRRRPNPRNRFIWELHGKMEKLVKEPISN